MSHLKFASDEEIRELERRRALEQKDRDYKHAKVAGINDDESESVSQRDSVKPLVREGPKVGRMINALVDQERSINIAVGRSE